LKLLKFLNFVTVKKSSTLYVGERFCGKIWEWSGIISRWKLYLFIKWENTKYKTEFFRLHYLDITGCLKNTIDYIKKIVNCYKTLKIQVSILYFLRFLQFFENFLYFMFNLRHPVIVNTEDVYIDILRFCINILFFRMPNKIG